MNYLEEIKPEEYNITSDKYFYNGVTVPRCTEILSDMMNNEGLMGWSNYLGFKRKKYKDVLNEAGDIGTQTHLMIEHYIKNEEDNQEVSIRYRSKVVTAFESFKCWWDNLLKNNKVRVLMQEEELVCPYFGGTLDLLVEINGKVYIVDFKTSNHPKYTYFLQLSAYRMMLRTERNIIVDGCIILMLNKEEIIFNEMLLDFSNPYDLDFINHCEYTYMSLAFGFYNKMKAIQMYNDKFS